MEMVCQAQSPNRVQDDVGFSKHKAAQDKFTDVPRNILDGRMHALLPMQRACMYPLQPALSMGREARCCTYRPLFS